MQLGRLAGPLAGLALSVGGLAHGQEPEAMEPPVPAAGPVIVPTVQVEAAPPEPAAPESATRRDPSGALTVIDTERFGGAAKDTAEVLASAPGLVVQDSGGWGQSKQLVMRGVSSNGALLLLDGIPLNGAGGVADLSRVPLALVERFEVLRGGAGARYGSGGLGGVVNVVTRRPQGQARVSAEATYGSWDTVFGSLMATGPLLGGEGLVLVHGGRSSGDFTFPFDESPQFPGDPLVERRRTNNDARQAGGLLRLRHDVGGLRADFLGELSLDDRGVAGTARNPLPETRREDGRAAASLRLSGMLPGEVESSARAFFRRDSLSLRSGVQSPAGSQALRLGGVEVEAQALVGGRHALSGSVSASREDVTGVESSTVGGREHPTWWRASAMVMDEVLLWDGAVVVAPSARVERAGPYTLLSPKLGLTVALPAGLEVRANGGQAHRAPSFLELYVRQGLLLPNPALRPERVLYADAALAHRTAFSTASVGGFYSLYEDLIAYELYPPFAAKPYNFASASAAGVEAEGEWRPLPWLSGAASYTLLVSRNLKDDPRFYRKELPYRPRHKLWARVLAGPRWLSGRVEVLAQSSQYLNRTAELSLPGRAFVHTGVSSVLGRAPEVTLSVECKNVFNVHSEDLDGYPLPGRSVYVSLAAALGGTSSSPGSKRMDTP
ncbi:TonB-dependent receptor [Myxococcaceae bacterium GXIMD 01537]